MMSKESFKIFAKSHPELATSVMNHKATWQDFYELYELYGEKDKVWDNYIGNNKVATTASSKNKQASMSELINMVKNVDLDSVQKTVGSLQKTIGLLQDIGIGSTTTAAAKTASYEPRPMYKYFDD